MVKIIRLVLIGVLSLTLFSCGSEKVKENETQSQVKQSTENSNQVLTITKEELKKYDGKGGNKAYVAVDGKVYDVTDNKKWKDGMHQGNSAGVDLSKEINASPHGKEILKDIKVIGELK